MVIYSNWQPLSSYPITQDETGPSHISLKYANGVRQLALDFGNQGVVYPITLDVDCKVTYSSSSQGNYIVVQAGEYKLMFVHVNEHAAVGSTVKAGGVICRLAPTSQNGGYAVHLHCSARKNDGEYPIRSLIFDTGVVVGGNVEFTAETNIRQGNGTSYPVQDVAKPGSVAKVTGGPRTGDGYIWYDCTFLSGTGWCIDSHMKASNKIITYPDGTLPPPPDPCQIKLDAQKVEYEKKLAEQKVDYEKQLESLRLQAKKEVPVLEASASRLKSL